MLFVLHFAALALANDLYTAVEGTTYLTANPDGFSKIAKSLGVTHTEVKNIYAFLYESFSGSIPYETFQAFQTDATLQASLEDDYNAWTKTHTGGGPTTALAYGVFLASLGIVLL
ncbi:hypothetical protein DICA4_F32506 [Diutina catenulata]